MHGTGGISSDERLTSGSLAFVAHSLKADSPLAKRTPTRGIHSSLSPHHATPSTAGGAPPRPSGLVTWSPIPGKGRGVIASVVCTAGTELERAPVIIVPAEDLLDREQQDTVPDHYLLFWSDEPGKELAMGCGLLMIYNHSADPNVEFTDGPEPDTISVVALRAIAAGEELTYDYGVELWFTDAARKAKPKKRTRSKRKRRSG